MLSLFPCLEFAKTLVDIKTEVVDPEEEVTIKNGCVIRVLPPHLRPERFGGRGRGGGRGWGGPFGRDRERGRPFGQVQKC